MVFYHLHVGVYSSTLCVMRIPTPVVLLCKPPPTYRKTVPGIIHRANMQHTVPNSICCTIFQRGGGSLEVTYNFKRIYGKNGDSRGTYTHKITWRTAFRCSISYTGDTFLQQDMTIIYPPVLRDFCRGLHGQCCSMSYATATNTSFPIFHALFGVCCGLK